MNCPKCGTPIPQGAAFCPVCNEPLSAYVQPGYMPGYAQGMPQGYPPPGPGVGVQPPMSGAQGTQPPPAAQRAFFHAQHRRGGRIGAQKPPPHPRGRRSRAAQSPRVIARQIQRRRPCRRLHPADRAGRNARIQQPCQRARARRRAGARPREHNAKPHFFALLPFSTGIIYAFRRPNTQKKSRVGGKNS